MPAVGGVEQRFQARSLDMSIPNEVFWSVLQTGEVVPLAIGGPGTAKTKSIEAFGRAIGRPVYTLIGSISEPTDMGGFPYPVQCDPIKDPLTGKTITTYMALVPPKWAVDMHSNGPWILFQDELTCNAPAVQAAMLRVDLEKRVGDFPLPPPTWICSACNPADQAANGHELEPPMANRHYHHPWQVDPELWDQGMMMGWQNIVPAFTPLPPDWRNGLGRVGAKIAAFRRVKPSLWSKMPEDRNKRGGAWPSPRTWTMAGICLAAVESHSPKENDLRYQAIAGCVGDDAAHEWSHWEKSLDIPDPEPIILAVIDARKAGRALNGEVPELGRADQALAFLGALSDRVLHHDPCQERWEAGMEVLASFWGSWKDLVVIAGAPMSMGYKPMWKMPKVLHEDARVLMERAGMFKKVGT
jgi:hypothetical protein